MFLRFVIHRWDVEVSTSMSSIHTTMGNLNEQAIIQRESSADTMESVGKLPTDLLKEVFVKNAKPNVDTLKTIADNHSIPYKKVRQWFATRRYQEKIKKV